MEDYLTKYDEVKMWKDEAKKVLDEYDGHGHFSKFNSTLFQFTFHFYSIVSTFFYRVVFYARAIGWSGQSIYPKWFVSIKSSLHCHIYTLYYINICDSYFFSFSDWFEDSLVESLPQLETELVAEANGLLVATQSNSMTESWSFVLTKRWTMESWILTTSCITKNNFIPKYYNTL